MSNPVPLDYQTPQPIVPAALKVVAWLFIITGVISILQALLDLTHSKITVNTGVLGVFVGPGLLRLRPGWRTCALVLLWIGMVFLILALPFMLSAQGSVNVDLLGLHLGAAPMVFALLVVAGSLVLAIWEYRVLVREDVRQLFGLPGTGA